LVTRWQKGFFLDYFEVVQNVGTMRDLQVTIAVTIRFLITTGGTFFIWNGLYSQQVVIPVVYHVLHNNGWENISDQQIQDQVELMNTAFGSYPAIPPMPPFDTIAASMDVQFCLATLDPNGEPTTGIDRIQTVMTYQGGDPASYIEQWPPDRYLNVWTVSGMGATGPAFYALLPSEAELAPGMDGVMILHNYVGRIGTSNPSRGMGAITRFGRYLNLKMMCEDSAGEDDCRDDEVDDTPPCRQLSALCTMGEESCLPGIPLNSQNYMALSYCMSMFTQGQRDRVYAALNSSVAHRNQLWSVENLVSTGCVSVAGTGITHDNVVPRFHPNPFREVLTLTGLGAGPVGVEFFDATGRMIQTQVVFPDGQGDMRLSGLGVLENGPYWVRTHRSGRGSTTLLIKQ
jgi:hypothetical protein